MDIGRFKAKPLLGILRDIDAGVIDPLFEAIIRSGLESVEITMNTPGAAELIRRAVEISGKRLAIGAGTVLSIADLKSALDAGASFIVMPVVIDDVLEYCLKAKIPVFPGAFTAQEIYRAWSAGATMVKVFPAKFFGPEYFKEIRGPFKTVELLACGGVTPENLKDYFSCGASAISFGAGVFRKDWLRDNDFSSIEGYIKKYLEAFYA